MSGIIEKLGITPGPWTPTAFEVPHKCIILHMPNMKSPLKQIPGTDDRLCACAPEMLETLITEAVEEVNRMNDNPMLSGMKKEPRNKKLIEKATGKTWEEIKRLL